MMASKFSPVFVGVEGNRRFLFAPLDTVQIAYLSALEVNPVVFTKMGSSTASIRSGYQRQGTEKMAKECFKKCKIWVKRPRLVKK